MFLSLFSLLYFFFCFVLFYFFFFSISKRAGMFVRAAAMLVSEHTHTHKNIEHHVLIGFLGLHVMLIARYSDKTLLVLITAEIKE